MIILLIWSTVLVAVLALFFHKTYSRFSDCGVKHLKVVPLFGNMLKVILKKKHLADEFTKTYMKFSEERFVGRYEFMRPTIMIRDLDLVKKITIKDFEYFLSRRGFIDEEVEPLSGRNLISLKGQEWKDMRSTLSPAFTSSKIKLMVPLMDEVGEQMLRALKKKIQESDGHIDVDCKDLTSRYTNDVIASCAFGLKVDSHADEKNQFYEMGKSISTFKLRQMLLFGTSACPTLVKKFKVIFLSSQISDFFINLVQKTMRDREARNIIRPDVIHLLMETKKGQLSHDGKGTDGTLQDTGFETVKESAVGKKTVNRTWSDIDLIAQAVLFLIAGFEPISIAMTFALFELARHPDIQERLVQEIKEQHAKTGGKLIFNSIQNMTYMDMVTSEVLRLWPPTIATERICTKDYNLGKPNGKAEKDFIMRKGEILWMPVWCFQRDPNYFPNPLKFDPERFSDENKHKINSMAYMPFGFGPRNCIGGPIARRSRSDDGILEKSWELLEFYGHTYSDFGFFHNTLVICSQKVAFDEVKLLTKTRNGHHDHIILSSRFSLCEMKALLYTILLHLEVLPSDKTVFTGELETDSFNPKLKGGHWLRFKCRN